MSLCEDIYNLLDTTLSEDALNQHIQEARGLKTLQYLLEYKKSKILGGKSQKINLRLHEIYSNNSNDIDIICDILKIAFIIIENYNEEIYKFEEFLLHNLKIEQSDENVCRLFKLLNTTNDFIIRENKIELRLRIAEINQTFVDFWYAKTQCSDPFSNFVITRFLPNYFKIINKTKKVQFFESLFNIQRSKKEIFYLLDTFVISSKDDDFVQLMNYPKLWEFIKDCILSKDSYLQKQSIYILSKIVENYFFYSEYIKLPNSSVENTQNAWKHFFLLIDVSNEKQLHLIEPSLPLLSSMKYLHKKWQTIVYKILLTHSQNNVVYYVAKYLLKLEWHILKKLLPEFLQAINKHEYSENSALFFKEFGDFCKRLTPSQLHTILEQGLKMFWIPTSIWCFYKSIFNNYKTFNLNIEIFKNILIQFQNCPNVFIRKNCTTLIMDTMVDNAELDSIETILQLNNSLLSLDNYLFKYFISKKNHILDSETNKKVLFEHIVAFQNIDNYDYQLAEVCIKILIEIDLLCLLIEVSKFTENMSTKSDFLFKLLSPNLPKQTVENYLEKRLNTLQNSENLEYLLDIAQNSFKQTLVLKAIDCLIDPKSNDNQQLIAFAIISYNFMPTYDYSDIINFWKIKITNPTKINNLLPKYFTILLVNFVENSSEVDVILEILQLQNNDVLLIVIENISKIIKNCEDGDIIRCLDILFNELLLLEKNHILEDAAIKLFQQIFDADLLKNYGVKMKLFNFIRNLSEMTVFNRVAKDFAAGLLKISVEHPLLIIEYISVIVELVLHGILVNKNERIEYSVYQDIASLMQMEQTNPNFEQFSVRFLALETIFNIVTSVEGTADPFALHLMAIYDERSDKRYFPDSQIHLEKLRILQALLLIYSHTVDETPEIFNFAYNKIIKESDQVSIRYMLQLLLIAVIKKLSFQQKFKSDLEKNFQDFRPTTKTYFIPVLYQIVQDQTETEFSDLFEMLLPYTMGAQFKLRYFSQLALINLYNCAMNRHYEHFIKKYRCIYESLRGVLDDTENSTKDVIVFENDFLESFLLDALHSNIFYYIPMLTNVTQTEWENIKFYVEDRNFPFMTFQPTHNEEDEEPILENERNDEKVLTDFNIQKKITPWRDHLEDKNLSINNNFILVTSLIEKANNLGGLSRTCEVFRIKHLVMRTAKITADKEFKSLSMSSENWIDIMEVKIDDLPEFFKTIKTKKYEIIGAEQSSDSVKLHKFKFPRKTVLVLGNEKEGIPPRLLPFLDKCVEIPQFGVVRSLNVHVAGAIMIWEYCKQHLLKL